MSPDNQRRMRLVLNGKAAGNPALREAVAAVRQKGHVLEVNVTWEAGDAARYAERAVRDQVDVVIAAGGDGTVSEVMSGMVGADVDRHTALGILPFGTANDFAQGCRIPIGDPLKALRLIVDTPAIAIDVGQVNDRYFINVASGGFGAQVTSRTPVEMKRLLGGAAYSLMGLVTAAKMTPCSARLIVDGQAQSGDLLLLAVGNGRQAGGGFLVTPRALLNDGLLDVMIVHDVDLAEFGRVLSELLDLASEGNRYVAYDQLKTFQLETEQPLQLNLDGEPLVGSAFKFRTLPQRIMCVLPKTAPLLLEDQHQRTEQAGGQQFVLAESLDSLAMAELVRIDLEKAGIPCRLEGLQQAGRVGALPIRVLVPRTDLDRARHIIANRRSGWSG
jgi:lipid kinase YegS